MNLNEAQQVSELFGLQGQCTVIKDSVRIETGDGPKCVKRFNYGIERLKFIYEVKEYIVKNGFPFIDRFWRAPDGEPYVIHNNLIYILTDWIDGKECDFDSMADIKKAVESLAQMHHCVKGFSSLDCTKVRTELGKLPATLKKRSEEMLKLKKIAKKGKNRFDYLYMDNVDSFIEKSLSSLKVVNSPIYERIARKAEEVREVCHRDYSYHNLIIDRQQRLHVVNFDYCCYEIRVYDIVSFLRKIMSECNWNVEVAINVVNWYDTVNKLNEDELEIILALMEFPQKFWRIANRYYNSRRTKPETGYYNKLADIIAEKEFYMDFLKKFKDYIKAWITA